MARFIGNKDSTAILPAARQWIERCMIDDGSLFGDERLWTIEHLEELNRHYVNNPDEGSGNLYEKLESQLSAASHAAKRLMAEAIWIVLLFPSNIGVTRKRQDIRKVWSWGGTELPATHPLLADKVLDGIGSGGMGINNHRWREFVYIVGMAIDAKRRPVSVRKAIFETYDGFFDWIEKVPMEGKRQFPLMLRYLLFPDRVERMSSDIDRRKILLAFEASTKAEVNSLSVRELDERLLKLRQRLAAQYETENLDFYVPPLRDLWNKAGGSGSIGVNDRTEDNDERTDSSDEVATAELSRARNVILYGPPGTGKTFQLQKRMKEYMDHPADLDRATWERAFAARYGWRAVIAAVLADLGQPARVQDILGHRLLQAKAAARPGNTALRATIWSILQTHADPSSDTVNVKSRREPFLFTKDTMSRWALVTEDWRELDTEAAELFQGWRNGPNESSQSVERYRLVTFHPSYSYEDFIIGLRPVQDVDDTSGGVRFESVPGVFMQICEVARANPSLRYAIFIDEINRADFARVFGELITLIEPDKRARYDSRGNLVGGLEVQLPGLGAESNRFGVPANLDIYGTMNTADRSIALLDIALRRRFEFEEIAPDYGMLDRQVEGIHLGRLLRRINDRLEFLIDRDHRIGHAYFIKAASLTDLRRTFESQIIPLLHEYFFDDIARVALVLATKSKTSWFVESTRLEAAQLFGFMPPGSDPYRDRYQTTPSDTWSAEAFRAIYENAPVDAESLLDDSGEPAP